MVPINGTQTRRFRREVSGASSDAVPRRRAAVGTDAAIVGIVGIVG
jgi:hypothetical protein